jgi:hypothetical protein
VRGVRGVRVAGSAFMPMLIRVIVRVSMIVRGVLRPIVAADRRSLVLRIRAGVSAATRALLSEPVARRSKCELRTLTFAALFHFRCPLPQCAE